jgi:hypothetical protein
MIEIFKGFIRGVMVTDHPQRLGRARALANFLCSG